MPTYPKGSAVAGDEFDGGAGSDTLVLGDAGNQIIVDNVENIQGGSGDDRIEIATRELGEPPSPPAAGVTQLLWAETLVYLRH